VSLMAIGLLDDAAGDGDDRYGDWGLHR
jgi:hypothetical protein